MLTISYIKLQINQKPLVSSVLVEGLAELFWFVPGRQRITDS